MKRPTRSPRPVSAYRTVVTSTVVDLVDAILTVGVALFTGSAALLAKGLQSVADLISDMFLLIGIRNASRPADERYPFGYGRSLFIWTLFSALVMLTLSAGAAITIGIQRVLDPVSVDRVTIAVSILVISLCANGYALSVSSRRLLGRSLGSPLRVFFRSSRVESKVTVLSDGLGFMSSLFGLLALSVYFFTQNTFFDALGAFFIGGLLIVSAVMLIVTIRGFLIGRSVDDTVKNEVREAARSVTGVRDVLDLKAVLLGADRILVNLEIHIDDGYTTDEIEVVIDMVKQAVRDRVPGVYHIQVEPETPSRDD